MPVDDPVFSGDQVRHDEQELEAISKIGFWFKFAAEQRFPRCAGFPI